MSFPSLDKLPAKANETHLPGFRVRVVLLLYRVPTMVNEYCPPRFKIKVVHLLGELSTKNDEPLLPDYLPIIGGWLVNGIACTSYQRVLPIALFGAQNCSQSICLVPSRHWGED